MALKFDGKYLKDGGRTLCNIQGDKIYEGPFASRVLCNIRGDKVRQGQSTNIILCNIRGDKIYEGQSSTKVLIKTSDAARKIGATSLGPTTAAMWHLFCR